MGLVGTGLAIRKFPGDELLPGGTSFAAFLAEACTLLPSCLGAGMQYFAEARAFSGGMC
jgi:hypothetical protein